MSFVAGFLGTVRRRRCVALSPDAPMLRCSDANGINRLAPAFKTITALCLTVYSALPVVAQVATFIPIVGTGSRFTSVGDFRFNDAGTVAFNAENYNAMTSTYTERGVYTANGGVLSTAFSGGVGAFLGIGNDGTVAFRRVSTGEIYSAINGTATFLVDVGFTGEGSTSGSGPTTFSGYRPAKLVNDSGTVAFGNATYTVALGKVTVNNITARGQIDSINNTGTAAVDTVYQNSVFHRELSSTNGIVTKIIDNPGGLRFGYYTDARINDAGTVAFDTNGDGIYTGNGVTTTTIADRTGVFSRLSASLDFNNAGLTAFIGTKSAGGSGIYTGSSALLTTVAETGGLYTDFYGFQLNDRGTVAFGAGRSTGGSGIFATLGGSTSPFQVVGIGDSFFGSTITDLGHGILNNNNQIAFSYSLADGRSGITVANISGASTAAPEPGSFALLTLGVPFAGFALRRRRKS